MPLDAAVSADLQKTRRRCWAAPPPPNRPRRGSSGSPSEVHIDAGETAAIAAAVLELWAKGCRVSKTKQSVKEKRKARPDSAMRASSISRGIVRVAVAVVALAAVHALPDWDGSGGGSGCPETSHEGGDGIKADAYAKDEPGERV